MDKISVFAPATVANLGPGFDIFGLGINGLGDKVIAKKISEPGVFIKKITGDNGLLPLSSGENTVSISASSFLRRLAIEDFGIEFELHKGMPINSGMGSSGASAVAGAFAALNLYGNGLGKDSVLVDCVHAEATVAGEHADNVAASLFGGIVVIKSYSPLEVVKLPSPKGLIVTVVSPEYEVPTKAARGILPEGVPLKSMVRNSGNVASFVSGIFMNDLRLMGRSVDDCIIEPIRGKLIPGFDGVKKAAFESGALGFSISGSGPSVFAFADSQESGEAIAKAISEAFSQNGLASKKFVSKINNEGAKVI